MVDDPDAYTERELLVITDAYAEEAADEDELPIDGKVEDAPA